MKILVATHKDVSYINNEILKPIQVGALSSDFVIDPSYFLDNTGDNISAKNVHYSEVTALYWMWKNLKDEDILGLVHYRRCFHFFENKFLFKSKNIKKVSHSNSLITKTQYKTAFIEEKVKKWLTDYDVIMPYTRIYTVNKKPATLSEDYRFHHRASDWDVAMKIIIDKYPEYEPSIEKYLTKGYDFFMCNMFIANYRWVDSYCTWLFDILFEMENRITPSKDRYQIRVFAFLCERLMSLYVQHNQFKIRHTPILFIKEFFEHNPDITNPKEFIEGHEE